ncbi:Ig-like domain-containing protein [Lentibacillus cibarius]|uniref:Ig-like domain-containing protein n=1 Tax=Lentibacillus cibarius TaxID=2583219 RepID=UPI0014871D12|nr:Ig-like domain-containing protein [Lentibacillus cibarius]
MFDSTGLTSASGELDESSIENGDEFSYKVVISKDDASVESSLADVKVVNKSATFTDITSYTLRLDSNDSDDVTTGTDDQAADPVLTSNTLVVGETAIVDELEGTNLNGDTEKAITDADFSSSNPAVATVNSNGHITAQSSGTTDITITKGDVTQTFTITVETEARELTNATFSEDEVKLVNGQTRKGLTGQATDQYGDPYFVDNTDGDLTVSSALNADDEVIAEPLKPDDQSESGVVTDKDGKFAFAIEASTDKVGSGDIEVKRNDTVVATVNVTVSDDNTAATHKLELSSGKDLTLDSYAGADDQTLTLQYNGYNADGYLVGPKTFKDSETTDAYSVKSSDSNIVSVGVSDNDNALAKNQLMLMLWVKVLHL